MIKDLKAIVALLFAFAMLFCSFALWAVAALSLLDGQFYDFAVSAAAASVWARETGRFATKAERLLG